MANESTKSPRDAFLRTVAVLGLIAVLLLGAWGIITLAVNLPNIFSSLGSGFGSALTPTSTESLQVSAAQSVASGANLEVSWTLKNAAASAQYSYSLSYSCATGVSMKAPLPTGAYQAVACNSAFNYVDATEHMILIPALGSGTSAQVTVTVNATDLSTGAIVATGNTLVTVTRTGAANTTTTTATKTTTSSPSTTYYPAQKAVASLYGYADLAVIINSVTPSGSRESVTFTIENIGTNRAPAGWTFNAILPVQGSYTFNSQTQRALNPGDKVVYTLSFDRPANNQYGQYGYNYPQSQNYNYNYQYPTTNSSYTCNNYGPCNVPGYINLYPYGSPYQYGSQYGNQYGNGYCPQGYGCSVPMNQYGNGYNGSGYSSGNTVSITADPYNLVQENNKANNTATTQAY